MIWKFIQRLVYERLSKIELHDTFMIWAKQGCGAGIMEAKLVKQVLSVWGKLNFYAWVGH